MAFLPFLFLFFNDWCPVFCGTVFLLLDCRDRLHLHFIVLLCAYGNGTGITQWESRGNGNNTYAWEWEGMGIDCMGMGGNGDVKIHSRSSLSREFRSRLVVRAAKGNYDLVDIQWRLQGGWGSRAAAPSNTWHFFSIIPTFFRRCFVYRPN